MIENGHELIRELEKIAKAVSEGIRELKESNALIAEESLPLVKQIKQSEEAIDNIHTASQIINEAQMDINDILINQLLLPIETDLARLRQHYLEEETDTPREAAENIKRYMENPSDQGLLLSALKWIKTQIPPIVEETEVIPYETARIETNGVDGEVKVTYELTEEEGKEVKVEIGREVITEMVREIIRVGTKETEE